MDAGGRVCASVGVAAHLQRRGRLSTDVSGHLFEYGYRQVRVDSFHGNPLISTGLPVNCLSNRL